MAADQKSKQIDLIFKDYYSGTIENRVKLRRIDLSFNGLADENIGGGRKQNEHPRVEDNRIIREESDHEMNRLKHNLKVLDIFNESLIDSDKKLMAAHYSDRNYLTWSQISFLINRSESMCHKDLNRLKRNFENEYLKFYLT
ncbi:DUF722 domain-containing protein [Fructobacillus americanaquae]|uniref:RinA family protein n=1 Tax=Fructobacillus americanaquae TaxID=2940302 RepID=A0ABY5C0A5_9LACO|nr:DUF722 domain-containing protein [Fructobacillus americanaquae]USS92022.1 RinA family protein [Fructobacillus americanaquae]